MSHYLSLRSLFGSCFLRYSLFVIFFRTLIVLSAVLSPLVLGRFVPSGEAQQPVTCNGLPATLIGTPGNDTLTGTNGNDVIVGLGSNDVINAGNGNDTICAGEGDDTVNVSNGEDWVDGDNGNDTITGDNGNDMIFAGPGIDIIQAGNGDDVVDAGDGDDNVIGDNGTDIVLGGRGSDRLEGGNGNDRLEGGDGNDTLSGQNGEDTLLGGFGNDTITADNGNDFLDGGSDPDRLTGGAGNDTCRNGETTHTCETIPINQSPTASAGPDQTQPVGTTIHLDGTASSDLDSDALTFQWTLVSKPTNSTATLSGATTALPTFVLDTAGTYQIQLVVSDGNLTSTVDIVIVSTTNSVSVPDAGADQSGTLNMVIHLDGSNSSDVDGNPLTYQWSFTSKPATSTATLTNPTSVTPQFTIDKPGTYLVQLIVNDGTVASPPDTVTISTVNSKPVAHAGTDQSGTVGTTITLDGSQSSDVDGDTLTYQWALTTKPANSTATLNDPTAVTPTFILDKSGTYTAQLLVNDGTVESDPDTVTISTLNTKPVAEAGDDEHGGIGAPITLDGTLSSDPDADPLTYQWSLSTKPANSTAILQNPTAATPSFVLDKPGTYTGQLIVNDGTVDSEPDTVTVTTLNTKPLAEADEDQTGQGGTLVQLNGSGSHDVDNNPLTYFWSFTAKPEGSTTTLSNDSVVNPTFTPDLSGTYVVQLIVHDGTVESDPDTVTLTVTTPDTFPPAPADLDKITISPITNGQVTVSGSTGSVEGGATVTITNPRTGETVTVTANADGGFTTQLAAQEGDQLSIVVTDAAGNSSPLRTVRVAPTAQVTITSPVSGASLLGTRVRVQGTVQGPVNTGVTVNGVVALVYNGVFVADHVQLVAGPNTLTAIAIPLGGQGVQAQVTVTSAAIPQVLEASATPNSGLASLEVTFTYQFGSPTAIQQLRMDFDGNGSFDFTTTDLTVPLHHTYTTPGLYVARIQMTDQQGGVFDADVAISVHEVATLDGLLKSLWNGMNASLVNGDIPTALTYLDHGAQEKYGPVWQVLLPHMAEIIASYSPLRGISTSGLVAEYGFTRIVDGEKRLFFVYFLQNTDGVWRLSAM